MRAVRLVTFYLLVIAVAVEGAIIWRLTTTRPKAQKDPQFAAGEWKIEVQTPPCDAVHNIQVIYPQESGAPIAIECDDMPVATR